MSAHSNPVHSLLLTPEATILPASGQPRAPRRLASSLRVLAAATLLVASHAMAQCAVGVIVDRGRANPARAPYVHTFDPATMAITGSVALPLPAFASVFDVEIAPDLSEAYVSNNDLSQVWVIDLTTSPPTVAAGTNPIVLTGGSEDLSLTRNGRFLLAASGNNLPIGSSLSVIDLDTRTEASALAFNPSSPTAVEVAADGSVLVAELIASTASSASSNVRRYSIDAAGVLTDTGQLAGPSVMPGVHNLLVPNYPHLPGWINALLSRHVVQVSRPAGMTMSSLRTNGLTAADSVTLAYPTGIDLCFDPWRSLIYVRTNELGLSSAAGVGNSRIDGYFFSPFTGCFGPSVMTVQLERRAGTAFGVEQTAVDPITRRLFVSGLAGPEVRVFNSLTGAQVGTITHPDLLWALGINVRRR